MTSRTIDQRVRWPAQRAGVEGQLGQLGQLGVLTESSTLCSSVGESVIAVNS